MKEKPFVEDIETYVQDIVDTVRESLLILDTTLRVRSANRAFYRTFQVTSEETENRLIYEMGQQVLYNLLSNAVKFTDDGGTVEIRAEAHDTDRVKLVINDTGIGIKAEDIGGLFKEFEQLESGAARLCEGTGLGLALTRKIVESQGGEIGVESEVGKGTCFRVVLPLVMTEDSRLNDTNSVPTFNS